jgi:hypothetical protein
MMAVCIGGHGAWMNAVSFPDFSACVSATAGWTRKEEYGGSNQFFELDISNSYIEPELKALLELSMSEFHVDRLVRNMRGKDVHIRVGERDRTTHPWYSRRMWRLLRQGNITAAYEEVGGMEHWWWDTAVANDGGVLNDPVLRRFYSKCYSKSSVDLLSENYTSGKNERGGSMSRCVASRAGIPLVLDVINPASHMGQCGVRIIQQFHAMRLSTVEIGCTGEPRISKECTVRTNGNVRRLAIDLSEGSYVADAVSIRVIDATLPLILPLSEEPELMELCWRKDPVSAKTEGRLCGETDGGVNRNPLLEKTVDAAGSVRGVYTRPLVIVYGTYHSSAAHVEALRQLAVYHANSHNAAHNTYVRVMTDEAYLAANHAALLRHNVIFVGAYENKAMRELCIYPDSTSREDNKKQSGMRCLSPVTFNPISTEDCSETCLSEQSQSFFIGHMTFSKPGHSAVFTLPITYYDTVSGNEWWSGVGACIFANSIQGYHDMSRLSWPVVPPMVRTIYASLHKYSFSDLYCFVACVIGSRANG